MPVLDKKYDGQSSANNASVKTGSSLAAAMVWLTTQLIDQGAVTAELASIFGEELARLRAEVLHLQRTIDSSGRTTRSEN